jgi:hypothetical protein
MRSEGGREREKGEDLFQHVISKHELFTFHIHRETFTNPSKSHTTELVPIEI